VNVPQLRIFKHHILVPKDLSTVTRAIDQVVEMVRQSLGIAGLLHVFEDFDDDGGVAVRVEVDFLVVGDLADLTFLVSDASGGGLGRERYLVSAKLEGRSTVIAPPKRGVVLNDIFFLSSRCYGIDCEYGDRERGSGLLLFLHGVVRGLYMFMLCRFGDVEVLV
jgi:hypothetical protein